MVVTYPVEGHFEHDHADRCGDVTDTLQMALMCADPRLQDIVVVHVDMAASARVIGNIPRRAFGETGPSPAAPHARWPAVKYRLLWSTREFCQLCIRRSTRRTTPK